MVSASRRSQGEPSSQTEAQVLDGILGFCCFWGMQLPVLFTAISVIRADGSLGYCPPSVSESPGEMVDSTSWAWAGVISELKELSWETVGPLSSASEHQALPHV